MQNELDTLQAAAEQETIMRNPTPTLDALYHAAMRADDAVSAELTRLYGTHAGDARYDARGTATAELRALWMARDAAWDAYRATFPRWMPVGNVGEK